VSHLDAAIYATTLALTRVRVAVLGGLGDVVGGLLGEPVRQALATGGFLGLVALGSVLLIVTILATRVVRALSTPRLR
jgi:hypothetical protein